MSEEERDFEEQLRELLAEDAYTIRPSPVPYPQIRRQGVVERRRRVAVAGAVLVTLAAVPVGAFAVGGGGTGTADTATTPTASASATADTHRHSRHAPVDRRDRPRRGSSATGSRWSRPRKGWTSASPWPRAERGPGRPRSDLGKADDYRIILALNSTGDSNSPGDGIFVVAVKEQADGDPADLQHQGRRGLRAQHQCRRATGSRTRRPVVADINGNKLYQQSFLDKGNWKLPFSWGFIGTVDPTVAKVTVSYGGAGSEAVLDHGWFVASGTLTQQVTRNPHIKGYDKGGKLIYDSDDDKTYQQVQ